MIRPAPETRQETSPKYPFPIPALLTAVLIFVLGTSGCRFIDEILHMTPPQVTGHIPREGEPWTLPGTISISFSAPMNRADTERAFSAFSYTRGASIEGRFVWEEDTRFLFYPSLPVGGTDRITVRIDETAEDIYGNSLAGPYSFTFSVGDPDTPLAVASTRPSDGDDGVPVETEIAVEFSLPVDEASFVSAFSIYPVSPGYFSSSAEGRTAFFFPREPLLPGTIYTVRVEESCSGADGGPALPSSLQFRFTTAGTSDPECEAAYFLPEEGIRILLEPVPALNNGIEKDPRIRFTFSETVPPRDRGHVIRSTPPAEWRGTWDGEGKSCAAAPVGFLEFGTVYGISAYGAEYRLYIDGPRSKPPEVVLLSCCADEAAGTPPVPVELDDYLHFCSAESGFFDFHIYHAEGGLIDTGSFFDAFSIRTTNGCVTLETTGFEIGPGSPQPLDPAEAADIPPPAAGVSATVVRTRFRPTDHGLPGTVTVILDEGLHDTYGNNLETEFSLTVNH